MPVAKLCFQGNNTRASMNASLGDRMRSIMEKARHGHSKPLRFARSLFFAAVAFAMTTAGLLAIPAVAASPCDPGSNPVVCENSKPGTSFEEWDIDGAGDDSIQGFATDISVNVGQRVDFKIDTDANAYTIDIYRTGWYQGLGARKITSIQPSVQLPQRQPECLSDITTELVDCGTWAVSASWNVPADAVSGIYLAKLTRKDNGDSSHITFIVRNDASTSDVLVQTSDPTWHAYNLYGGSDFYSGADNGRAFKLSYNRPFATRAGVEARDFYFGAEYPLVRFLERNGYDVSYFSGVDTDRHGELLKNHKVFVSVGHDEYWSGEQRKNVEDARDAGVNLQFLTGNEVYWRTRYEKSPTDQKDYRTLVSYKETWGNNKIDPATEWTGTWRDPRYASTANGAGLPENELTGTAYVVNHGDLPVQVSSAEGQLRMWRDTTLDDMASGTVTDLAPHTVGYESNEVLDNGYTPPGLIYLSTTTGSVPEYLQDFGNQVAPGETTHHTTLYKAASGALVFSAGSIQWTWGLDQWHDGDGAEADARMQQAQVNLLADMDALPTDLMDGLVMPTAPKDLVAPTVTVTDAPSGTVKNGQQITVSGTASDTGGIVAAVEYSFDGGTTWSRAEGTTAWTFTAAQQGTGEADLLVRAIDDSANYPQTAAAVSLNVSGPYSVFGDVTPKVADAQDNSAVELGLRFTAQSDGYITGVRFYKSTANTGTHTGTLWSLNGAELATVTFANESASGWRSASFAEPIEAHAGDEFVVSYYAPNGHYSMAVQDFAYRGADANPLTAAGGFGSVSAGLYISGTGFPTRDYDRSNYYVDAVFETGASIGLSAYGQSPADTAVSVSPSTGISATLSKQVDAVSVAFSVVGGQNNPVPGSTAYNATTRKATFTPQEPLARGTDYTVTLSATDTTGNQISRGGSWTFRTMYPDPVDPNACPCGLYPDSEVPAVLAVTDGTPVTLGTRFSSALPGTVTGIEFYRSPGETGAHTGWLYSTSGEVLAEVTFPDDSANGWQYAEFSAPVAIAADTEYVVAYRSNGTFPITAGGLGSPLEGGPLRTTASAGQFSYPAGYPDSLVSTSYLVDVRFQAEGAQVTLTSRTPAAGTSDVAVDSTISAIFSEPLESGATLEVSSAAGPVQGTVTVSSDGKTLQFAPSEPLEESTLYTVAPQGISGTESGTAEISSWFFRTAGDIGSLSSFLGDATPAQLDPSDTASVELGVRLSTAQDIEIHALRYYQGPQGAGAHTGSVWDAEGNLLATAAFASDGTTGWQVTYLSEPLQIAAGTTFTVSYQAPNGGYVFTGDDFSTGTIDGVLSLKGANGVFRYGTGSMPTSSWNSTNYFADLLYQVTGGSTEPTASPTETPAADPLEITARTPSDQASGIDAGTAISVSFNQAVDEGSTLAASTAQGNIAGTVQRSADGRTLAFTPDDPLGADAIVTVTPTDIVGTGTGAASFPSWKFRTAATAQDPTSCPCGLFGNTELPTVAAISEGTPLTLGIRFSTDVPGELTGLEFYRAIGETGPHTGRLYSSTGEVLAEVSFPDTGVSGWQSADFGEPVAVEANTNYVATYRSNGTYAASPGAMASSLQVGHLKAGGSDGLYSYPDAYPISTVSTSYLVDVRFMPDGEPLGIEDRSPAAGASEIAVDSSISVTFTEPVQSGATLEVSSGGTAVVGSAALDGAGTKLTFTPQVDLPAGSVIMVAPQGIVGTASGAAQFDSWTFLTAGQTAQLQSFLDDQVPDQLDPEDTAAVELGLRLQATEDLTIHALRYYRGSNGSGASEGHVWDDSGTQLTSVTFGASTAPGWYTAYLATPLQLSSGTEFTVSYFTPVGGYVYSSADFAGGRSGEGLELSGANGVFAYGASSRPSSSWNSSNYFADLLYSLDDATASAMTEQSARQEQEEKATADDTTTAADSSAEDGPSETAASTAENPAQQEENSTPSERGYLPRSNGRHGRPGRRSGSGVFGGSAAHG